jgi:hypothetical protein
MRFLFFLKAIEESFKQQLYKSNPGTGGPAQPPLDFSRFKAKFQAELQKGLQEAREDLKRRQK